MEKAQEHHHHIIPASVLFRTLIILAVLMALTILVYAIDFGHILSRGNSELGSYINNGIALTIACIKAYYVVMFFMGVKYVTKLTKMWVACGFVWVTLLALTFGDYFTRHWEPSPGWYKGDTEMPLLDSQYSQLPKPEAHEGAEAGGH